MGVFIGTFLCLCALTFVINTVKAVFYLIKALVTGSINMESYRKFKELRGKASEIEAEIREMNPDLSDDEVDDLSDEKLDKILEENPKIMNAGMFIHSLFMALVSAGAGILFAVIIVTLF